MNTVTKIFIILNLLLALLVAYVVPTIYAYQENYKRRWDKDTRELVDDIRNANQKTMEQSYRATNAETALQNIRTDRDDLVRQVDEQQAEIAVLNKSLTQYNTTINELTIQTERQREQIASLSNDLELARKRQAELNHIAQVARAVAFQLNVKLAEVEDDLNNAQAELTRRERDIFNLERDGKRKDAMLALVKKNYPRVWNHVTADKPMEDKVIRGVVAAVRLNPQGQQDLVMLTVGEDDSVREGMEFIIYRSNTYIVKVRAERVLGDMVACRVIADAWNTRGELIQQGDLAQNRLF